jgi:hypothetical protein
MPNERRAPEKGEWHLDAAEVIEGAEDEASGMVLLWLRHVPTGIEALARIPRKDQEVEQELKPLLFAELEEKVARKLRIPGRKWSKDGSS